MFLWGVLATLGLTGCQEPGSTIAAPDTIDIKLIAFNDLHGNLAPPNLAVTAPNRRTGGAGVSVPAGGAAYMASAIAALKARNPRHAVISAGDMIGASPLASALFLDEPTIEAVNAMGIDFNAVGNHEFDKGRAELLRMQHGGCARHTALEPCRVNPSFAGANFEFLAANTVQEDHSTLFPAVGMKSFTQEGTTVKVAFIGLTLKATPTMVTPSGVAGLTFTDEADTANALIPGLKAQGADAIVVLIHEGATTTAGHNDKRCAGLTGDLLAILDRLDPSVDIVVSGHTHRAYVCDYGHFNSTKPFLLTSAGQYGTQLTDITLSIDTRTRRVRAKSADNVIVQGEAFTSGATTVPLTDQYPVFPGNPSVAALIERYTKVAAPLMARHVGQLSAPVTRTPAASRENALGNLVADAQLFATSASDKGAAQLAFINPGGLRADLVPSPEGRVTYGQVFSVQPFGNSLMVKTLTGAQLRAVLEQQFDSGSNSVTSPHVLMPSRSLSYDYDLSRPSGSRIGRMTLNGTALSDTASYRVAMNSFLAAGGDNFTVFEAGTNAVGGGQDIDALETYFAAHRQLTPPATDRIRDITRR